MLKVIKLLWEVDQLNSISPSATREKFYEKNVIEKEPLPIPGIPRSHRFYTLYIPLMCEICVIWVEISWIMSPQKGQRLSEKNGETQSHSVYWLSSPISSCSFVRPSLWLHLHWSPPYDVLDHTNHIFSESLSSVDDNGRDEDLQKRQRHTDTDKDKN